MKRNLAFIGPQGAGKSTIASILADQLGYVRLSIADPIKALARDTYPGLEKDSEHLVRTFSGTDRRLGRELLQEIGAKMREVDLDFWLRQFARRYTEVVKAGRLVVIDDVRLDHEVRYLQHIDPLLSVVRIHAHAVTRSGRLGGKVISSQDITETGWNLAPYDFSLDTTTLVPQDAAERLVRWMEEDRR
jgi:dephospho-CoA kinase